MRSEEQIEAERDKLDDHLDATKGRSKWPAMSYEDGVRATIDWILENVDEPPIEEE